MPHRSWVGRRGAGLLALLLHVLVLGAAPLADSSLDAEHRSCPVALTAQADSHGGPGHDHQLCQYCRLIGGGWSPFAPPERIWVLGATGVVAVFSPRTVFVQGAAASSLGARAPPTV